MNKIPVEVPIFEFKSKPCLSCGENVYTTMKYALLVECVKCKSLCPASSLA